MHDQASSSHRHRRPRTSRSTGGLGGHSPHRDRPRRDHDATVAHAACAEVWLAAILHHELVIGIEKDRANGLLRRLARFRIGQLLGLLFLIGPLADLADAGHSPARVAAILPVLAAFAALYLALLPPIRPLARSGDRAIGGWLALLAALAALTLALGAPRSFTLLFVYVVAVAGIALPLAAAAGVTVAGAAAVGVGLAIADSDGSTVVAWTLTVLGIGALTVARQPPHRARARRPRGSDDERDRSRDRRTRAPFRRNRAELPQRRDPQARGAQPRRGAAHRRGEGLALADLPRSCHSLDRRARPERLEAQPHRLFLAKLVLSGVVSATGGLCTNSWP